MARKPTLGPPGPTPCPHCDGIHSGSGSCPYMKPCAECGRLTIMRCADCGIDSGGDNIVPVCERTDCRDQHEGTTHKSALPHRSQR